MTTTGATPEQVEAAASADWDPDAWADLHEYQREAHRNEARTYLAAVVPPGARVSSPEREQAITRILFDIKHVQSGITADISPGPFDPADIALIMDAPR